MNDHFAMPVPLYADFDGHMIRIGNVRMVGNSIKDKISLLLPRKPRKVLINANHDILEM